MSLATHSGAGLGVFGGAAVLSTVLGVAAQVVRYRDRRADRARRTQLGLAQHRRFLSPTIIGVIVGLGAYLIVVVLALGTGLAWSVATHEVPTNLDNPSRMVAVGCLVVYGGLAALMVRWLVRRQRRRIAADYDRVADLDRQAITDDPPPV